MDAEGNKSPLNTESNYIHVLNGENETAFHGVIFVDTGALYRDARSIKIFH